MRVTKSENEVVQMRRLGQASGRSFTEAMRQDFTREKDLYSFLEYQFKVNGCDTNAFVPVVAGGQVNAPAPQHLLYTDPSRTPWLFITPGTTTCSSLYILICFSEAMLTRSPRDGDLVLVDGGGVGPSEPNS